MYNQYIHHSGHQNRKQKIYVSLHYSIGEDGAYICGGCSTFPRLIHILASFSCPIFCVRNLHIYTFRSFYSTGCVVCRISCVNNQVIVCYIEARRSPLQQPVVQYYVLIKQYRTASTRGPYIKKGKLYRRAFLRFNSL